MFSGIFSIHEVSGIELDTRFIGIYFQSDTAGRRIRLGCQNILIAVCIQHPVQVIPTPELQLLERVVNLFADSYRSTLIQRSTINRTDTYGNQSAVNRSVVVCINHNQLVQHIGTGNTGEIEITMVCQVHNRLLVGCSFIFDTDSIVIRQRISNLDIQISGEAGFTVF